MTLTTPMLTAPTSLNDLLAAIKAAGSIDECPYVTTGEGRNLRVHPQWTCVVGGTEASHSDLWRFDGTGRVTVCRRTEWDAKKGHYDSITHAAMRLHLTPAKLRKIRDTIGERTKDMYLYRSASFNCWQTTPWKDR